MNIRINGGERVAGAEISFMDKRRCAPVVTGYNKEISIYSAENLRIGAVVLKLSIEILSFDRQTA